MWVLEKEYEYANQIVWPREKERRRQVMRMEHMYASRNCQNSALAAPLGLVVFRLCGCRLFCFLGKTNSILINFLLGLIAAFPPFFVFTIIAEI